MSPLRGGLFPGLAVVFQFDFRVQLLFWFLCLCRLRWKLRREVHLNIITSCEKGGFCSRRRRGLEGKEADCWSAPRIVKMWLWGPWCVCEWSGVWVSPAFPLSHSNYTNDTQRVLAFWPPSRVYTAGISLPRGPVCSGCSLRNDSSCRPFTLRKYQPRRGICMCLMKYTSSRTAPQWLIHCHVTISIKISSQHEIGMLSLIAIWSEEIFFA